MKQQHEYPALKLAGKHINSDFKLIKTPADGKMNLRQVKNDVIFTVRFDVHQFAGIIRNVIRNYFFEDFKLVVNDKENHLNSISPDSEEKLPILMLNNYRPLTSREIEIMDLLLLGYIRKQIATKLNMNFNTLKNQFKRIYFKLGVRSKEDADTVYRKLYNKPKELSSRK